MSLVRARRRSADVAAIAIWLVYASIYALTFVLGGGGAWMAIRAALANAIPDGFLALAALKLTRSTDPAAPHVIRRYVMWGIVLVAIAAAFKALLLLLDFLLVVGTPYDVSPAVVTWQTFLSALSYTIVIATSHAALIARRLREEEGNAVRAEALRARAEITALRAQLNPHFLFNTLHSVLGLVRRDPAHAEAALEKLGDLLRYATRVHRHGVDWIALRHERDFVNTYLDLEAIRLGNRLRVVRHIDDAVLDTLVPTFSLQPLVENAVRHGVAPRADGGEISIAAQVEPHTQQLKLEVANDGIGRAATDNDEGGLGQRVLRDRLEALYRGAATMTAGPTPAGGYSVVLILPAAPTQQGHE